MVVVDKLTKVEHFKHVKMTHKESNIAEISRIHGVRKAIVSNRDTKVTSIFWKGFFKRFGTNMNFSTACHPESYGKIERVNHVIGYMLRMYVMD
jgi:hypothetical protein